MVASREGNLGPLDQGLFGFGGIESAAPPRQDVLQPTVHERIAAAILDNLNGSPASGELGAGPVQRLLARDSAGLKEAVQRLPAEARAALEQRLGRSGLHELISLSRDAKGESFGSGLLSWAKGQEAAGRHDVAAGVYQLLDETAAGDPSHRIAGLNAATRQSARDHLAVLSGGGPAGMRFVHRLQNIHNSIDGSMIVGMAVGSTVFTGVRSLFLQGLLNSPTAGLLTRGFGARFVASSGAFLPEVGAFWGTSKVYHALNGTGSLSWDPERDPYELRSLVVGLGALKLFALPFAYGGQWAAAAQGAGLRHAVLKASQPLWEPAGMWAGIMAGHGAEQHVLGWQEAQGLSSFLTDSLFSLAELYAGAKASQIFFAPLYRLNHGLNTQLMAQERAQIASAAAAIGRVLDRISFPRFPGTGGGLVSMDAMVGRDIMPGLLLPEAGDLNVRIVEGPSGADARSNGAVVHGSGGGSGPEGTPELMSVGAGEPSALEILTKRFTSPSHDSERARLYSAFTAAELYFQQNNGDNGNGHAVNQQMFLDRVLMELRRTEGPGTARRTRYPSAFSVLSAVRAARYAWGEVLSGLPELFVGAPPELPSDPISAILSQHPVDIQGGYLSGSRVADGAPRRTLNRALRLVRDLSAGGDTLATLAQEMRTRRVVQEGNGTLHIHYVDGRASVQRSDGSFYLIDPGRNIQMEGERAETVHGARFRIRIKTNGDAGFRPTRGDEDVRYRPISERVYEARRLLAEGKVRLVTALGSGRHGTAVMDIVRNSMGIGERIGGEYVIPVMLDQSLDLVHELNIYGTNQARVPNININYRGHLGLKAAHPRLNSAYLALADTVIVPLPSQVLDRVFTPDFIHTLSPRTAVVAAMKSLKADGSSIPEWLLHRFAQEGRFDLMHNLVLQTGLGFPTEMMGDLAPRAPVMLSVSSINTEMAYRVARLLTGDGAKTTNGGGTTFRALNRSVEVSEEMLIAAYWSYMKNFLAPGIGYDLAKEIIERGPGADVQGLERFLGARTEQAIDDGEATFIQYELPALRTKIEGILVAMDQAVQRGSVKDQTNFAAVSRWLRTQISRSEEAYVSLLQGHFTGIEDLLGCAKIQGMKAYQRIVWDLLAARGLTFERRLAEHPDRIKGQASSTNLMAGLLRPVLDSLWQSGRIIEAPAWADYTAEGITGLPYTKARWGDSVPPFVQATLAWLEAPHPPGELSYHPTGIRNHAKDVLIDHLRRLDDGVEQVERVIRSRPLQRRDLRALVQVGDDAVSYLAKEISLLRPVSERGETVWGENVQRLQAQMTQFRHTISEFQSPIPNPIIEERIKPFLVEIRRASETIQRLFSITSANSIPPPGLDSQTVSFDIARIFEKANKILAGEEPAASD